MKYSKTSVEALEFKISGLLCRGKKNQFYETYTGSSYCITCVSYTSGNSRSVNSPSKKTELKSDSNLKTLKWGSLISSNSRNRGTLKVVSFESVKRHDWFYYIFFTARIRRMTEGNVFTLFTSGGGGGEPHPHPGQRGGAGTPLPHRPGQIPGRGGGTPYWNSIAGTCYAAGGMPLAFTQEDFLIFFLPCRQCEEMGANGGRWRKGTGKIEERWG